jgi:hypothetical protein
MRRTLNSSSASMPASVPPEAPLVWPWSLPADCWPASPSLACGSASASWSPSPPVY